MDAATWDLVADERRSIADLLGELTREQWETQSLCTQWRIRDVAAHLAMTPAAEPTVSTMIKALVRTRGDLWGAGRDVARAYAEHPTHDLVDQVRRTAAARTKPVFVVDDNILLDLVVHGQDIAIPLGLSRVVPARAGQISLARSWAMGWPFQARRRLTGVRLEATDCDWSAGEGPLVSGSAGDLLLLMTRRPIGAQRLSGPGLDLLAAA